MAQKLTPPGKKSTPKRRTPTKASRAAANTKSILHYFSPKSTPKNKQSPLNLSLEKKQLDMALQSASSASSIHTISDRNRELVSKAVMKLQFISDSKQACSKSTDSPDSRGEAKRKRTLNAALAKQDVPSRTKVNDTDTSATDNSESSNSSNDFLSLKKKVKISPSTTCNGNQSAREASDEHNSNSKKHSNEVSITAKMESNTQQNQEKKQLHMGLIRILGPNASSFTEICKSLESDSKMQTIYPLYNGAIIGRDDTRKTSTGNNSSNTQKVSIGISPDENGVSRKQLQITNIFPPKGDPNRPIRPLDKVAVSCRWDEYTFKHHWRYLEDKQFCSPYIQIFCSPDVLKPILVRRLVANNDVYIQSWDDGGEPVFENVYCVSSGQYFSLKVGDVIQFDPQSDDAMKNTGKYMYRLVSYVPKDGEGDRFPPEETSTCIQQPMNVLSSIPVKKSPVPSSANADAPSSVKQRIKDDPSPLRHSLTDQIPIQSITIKEDPDTSMPNVKLEQDPHVKTLRAPRKGDQFRIVNTCEDYCWFRQRSQLWSIGVVERVKKNARRVGGYELKVKYSDGDCETLQYPQEDMEIIVPKEGSPTMIYTLGGIFACDSNPKSLFIGDYVECFYQNGNRGKNEWFQGRIAFISSDRKTANVAYFDGEYEVGVPIHMSKIRLLSRGSYCASNWLVGASLSDTISISPETANFEVITVHTKLGISPDLEPNTNFCNELWCEVKNSTGTNQEISYEIVAKQLFSGVRSTIKEKIWPGYNPIINCSVALTFNGKSFVLSSSSIEEIENETETGDSIDDGGTLWMDRLPDLDFEHGNPFADLSKSSFSNDDREDMCVEMSQDTVPDSCDDNNFHELHVGPLESIMQPAISNSCWRALNSTEPHNGFGLLSHMKSSWNIIPSEKLADCFSNFLVHGPECEGNNIKEPHRTEMAFSYMNAVMGKLQNQNYQIKPKAEELKEILLLPTKDYVHSGDMSESELYNLTQSLQFCSNRLSFVAKSLTLELKDIMKGCVTNTHKLNDLPFVSQLLKTELRDSLRMPVRSAMVALLQHGHCLVDYAGPAKREMTPNEQLCAKESLSCVKSLGTIISNAAFLFCAREGIPFADERCCVSIKEAADDIIDTFDFSKVRTKRKSAKNNEKFKRDMELRFLLSLDTSFSRALQIRLSQLCDLSTEVMQILG